MAVKKKPAIVALGILTVLVMVGVFVVRHTDPYGLQAAPRREWKDRALAEIAEKYYLRAFDGHSDECLQMTWPPKRKRED